jgi:serine protease Do
MNLFDKLRTQKVLSFTLILFTLSVGIVIGTLVNQGVKAAKSDNPAAPNATPLVIPNPVELSNSFSQLAKQVEPSVVNISTEYLPKAPARSRGNGRRQVLPPDEDQQDGGSMDDFIYRFFGNGGGGGPEMPQR